MDARTRRGSVEGRLQAAAVQREGELQRQYQMQQPFFFTPSGAGVPIAHPDRHAPPRAPPATLERGEDGVTDWLTSVRTDAPISGWVDDGPNSARPWDRLG